MLTRSPRSITFAAFVVAAALCAAVAPTASSLRTVDRDSKPIVRHAPSGVPWPASPYVTGFDYYTIPR